MNEGESEGKQMRERAGGCRCGNSSTRVATAATMAAVTAATAAATAATMAAATVVATAATAVTAAATTTVVVKAAMAVTYPQKREPEPD
jgi:hypothetical protein